MRFLFALLICCLASASFAASHRTWYVVSHYNCTVSNGTTVSYDQSKDQYLVTSSWGALKRTFYTEAEYYDHDSKLSVIGFTGHKFSAGPSPDPWETAYSIRFSGMLPTGVVSSVKKAVMYRNVAFTGWVQMPVSVNCDVFVERTL